MGDAGETLEKQKLAVFSAVQAVFTAHGYGGGTWYPEPAKLKNQIFSSEMNFNEGDVVCQLPTVKEGTINKLQSLLMESGIVSDKLSANSQGALPCIVIDVRQEGMDKKIQTLLRQNRQAFIESMEHVVDALTCDLNRRMPHDGDGKIADPKLATELLNVVLQGVLGKMQAQGLPVASWKAVLEQLAGPVLSRNSGAKGRG